MQLFLLAVFLGFTSSMPVGPINLLVADAVLNRERVRKFVFGVIIADVGVLLAVNRLGMQTLVEGVWANVLWAICSLFVLLLACGMLLTLIIPTKTEKRFDILQAMSRDSIGLGFLLCAANPAFWIFWFSASNLAANTMNIESTALVIATMGVGVALGDLAWFGLLIRMLKHSLAKFGEKVILGLRASAAFLLMVVAAVSLVQACVRFFSNQSL